MLYLLSQNLFLAGGVDSKEAEVVEQGIKYFKFYHPQPKMCFWFTNDIVVLQRSELLIPENFQVLDVMGL